MKVNWNYPTSIWFGPGRLAELPAALVQAGMARPLVVTDPELARTPVLAKVRSLLPQAAVFDQVRPNPTGETVQEGLKAFRAAGCDGVVAVGGGSSLDAGKAVALMVGQHRPLWDFEDEGDNYQRVEVAGMAPVVAVPTTSGTGAEVGRVAVITDAARHSKRLIFHPRLVPALVIADPELTVGMPARLTAAVGMDALSHNLEAYCSPTFHPMADGVALEGMRLIKNSLVKAYRDGTDLPARAEMLAASLMGAVAFQKGLGAIHSMSHPVGGLFNTHHGLTNAVVMPYVLEFNQSHLGEKLPRLERYLELPGSLLDWILDLRQQLEIPATLQELGVDGAALDELSRQATADPSAATNPRPLDYDTHRQLFKAALGGS
ncbi:MAG: iron-containing alcohol dehydrogenase [Vulcanimicrobiota bacterium]